MITLLTLSLPLVQLTNYIPSTANGYVARNGTTHSTDHVVYDFTVLFIGRRF